MKIRLFAVLFCALSVILSLPKALAEAKFTDSVDQQHSLTEESALAWWPDGATLDLGLRFSQSKVTLKNATTKAKLAELSSISLPSPSFAFSSRFKTWRDTKLGYKLKIGFSWFTIKTQLVNNELVDLDTAADGYSISVTPVAGYEFGDSSATGAKRKSLLIGLGVGAGYLISSGSVQLTESTNEVKKFNFNQPSLAFQFILDAKYENWNIGLNVGGPSITDGDFQYEFFDVSLLLGHSFGKEDFSPSSRPKVMKNDTFFAHTTSLFVAIRELPVLSNEKFVTDDDNKSSTGVGVSYTLQPIHWPLAVSIDLSVVQASSVTNTNTDVLESGVFSNVSLEATLIENHIGLIAQRSFSNSRWSWSAGGGVATFYTNIDGTKNNVAISDDSFDFGYWLGGGVNWHLKNKSLSLSLEARLVSVQTEILNVFEEGTKSNVRLGLNYHF